MSIYLFIHVAFGLFVQLNSTHVMSFICLSIYLFIHLLYQPSVYLITQRRNIVLAYVVQICSSSQDDVTEQCERSLQSDEQVKQKPSIVSVRQTLFSTGIQQGPRRFLVGFLIHRLRKNAIRKNSNLLK